MSWTLNGVSLDAASITAATLTFRSQAADEFEFVISLDAMAASPYPKGSSIELKQDGDRRFLGVVASNGVADSGGNRSIKVKALGPFHYLETTCAKGTNFYFDDTINATVAKACPEWSIPVGNTAAFSVEYLLDSAVPAQLAKGTVDLPTLVLPEERTENTTYAEALRRILRWCPGAFTWVDYTFTTPRLNVVQITNLTRTYIVDQSYLSSLSYEELADGKPAGVVVAYDARWSITEGGISGLIAKYDRYFRWETERYPVGALEGSSSVLFRRINVPQMRNVYLQELKVSAFTLNDLIQNSTGVNFWTDARKSEFSALWASINPSWTAVGPSHSMANLRVIRWEGDAAGVESVGALRWTPTAMLPEMFMNDGSGIIAARVALQIQVSGDGIVRQGEFLATNEAAGTRIYEFSRPQTSYVVTTGIAQKLYQQLQTDRYQGSLVLSSGVGDPSLIGMSRLVLPSPHPPIPGVQRVKWDLFSGRQEVQFGGNPILGPEDMISLLRPR